LDIREGVALIVGLIVCFYVFAYTFPAAATTLSTVAWTSVNAGVVALGQIVLPLVAIVAIIMYFIKSAT
jgi:hypothetical protein